MSIPSKSTLYKNIQRDSDPRGQILSIVEHPVQNVSIIESFKGSHRSNHYHHKDFHFMYVLEGKIDYFFKDLNSNNINYLEVNCGNTIFTPNKEIHATFFPCKTKLIVSSRFPRDRQTYENDTVRVNFLTKENIENYLIKYAKK